MTGIKDLGIVFDYHTTFVVHTKQGALKLGFSFESINCDKVSNILTLKSFEN